MAPTIGSREEIKRILADPEFEVAPAPEGTRGIAWLRANVCRFSNGQAHSRRRALVEVELARLDAEELRRRARGHTELILEQAHGHLEVMGSIARTVPLAVLCAALGVPAGELNGAVADATLVGTAYLLGTQDPNADDAVGRLVALLARDGEEPAAAALAVLAQACEATAALIGNGLALVAQRPELAADVDRLLAVTLRTAAPLRVMRRVSAQGEHLVLDLEAATRAASSDAPPLTFGSGLRPCPGEREALALAGGALEALLARCSVALEAVHYALSPVFRLPARVDVSVT